MAAVAEKAADKVMKAVEGVTVAVSEARASEATLLLRLSPEALRRPGRDALAAAVRRRLAEDVQEAVARLGDPKADALPPPRRFAVTLVVQDVGAAGGLSDLADRLAAAASKVPGLTGVFADAPRSVPQLFLTIDRARAKELGVDVGTILETLRAAGVGAVGDTAAFGRTWELRADLTDKPRRPDDLKKLLVRNAEGKMVPLGAFMQARTADSPRALTQLDGHPTALVTADLMPGADVTAVRAAVRKAVAGEWNARTYRVLLWGAGLDEPEDLAPGR
jgi:multidrug efflux pump subunit AcrB